MIGRRRETVNLQAKRTNLAKVHEHEILYFSKQMFLFQRSFTLESDTEANWWKIYGRCFITKTPAEQSCYQQNTVTDTPEFQHAQVEESVSERYWKVLFFP